ncbi:5-oxoprolinase subunit C family protein [Cochlodiniinecator piscidefendens]|uniref:5-oxoprolinase subunit C family protein n=1 Tax=Cochlodiniinecator piscidefendens TaxID=2715756 RepID=UPI001409C81C|nr:biotin-dependent carboxyltransferase family protein [Cochlodiniinecator piscidefendens]
MSTKFHIDAVGPFVSLQDRGRSGLMRFGVTGAGPMDPQAFAILRAALEGEDDFSAIEVSLGGITLTCQDAPVTAGFIGGDFIVELDGVAQPSWSVFTVNPGTTLRIRAGNSGSWGYLGFAGQIEGASWLNSQSTLIGSGLCGAAYQSDDVISITDPEVRREWIATLPIPEFARFKDSLNITLGPQDHLFDADALQRLLTMPYKITAEYDRMGMRLAGGTLSVEGALSIPSEALLRGAVQVPGHGDPLILLADHQTTGGYPKIARVTTPDQHRLVQGRVGDTFRFTEVSASEAVTRTRTHHRALMAYVETIPDHRGTFEDRLNRANLISGMVGPDDG